MIAQYVEFVGGEHNCNRLDIPIRFQGRTGSSISVKEDVWIGAHSVILGGVTIGKGACI
ncbi:hypothetical protein [Desulfosalsimonas sp.]|uniref:hypothetical protein n=1 Tax=Desulfosalsimonas sp. TaxID=3073848 RepID=UPI003970AFB8